MDLPNPAVDVARVIDNELRLTLPAVRRDRATVAAMLDPQFREFGASGRVWDRDGAADLLAGEEVAPPRIDDMEAVRLGLDVVLLTYRTRTPERTALRSSVWHRNACGRWQIVFHQATVVP